jgi:hypothetical protein
MAQRRIQGLGRSIREHRRAFQFALDSGKTFHNRAVAAVDCATRLHWYRDAWMKAAEAQTHLIDSKAFARPKSGRTGVYQSEWTADERKLNNLMKQLDRLTEGMEKTCLRRGRRG